MQRHYLLSALLLGLVACSSHTQSTDPAAPTDATEQKAEQLLPQVFTGTLTQKDGQWLFSPCDSDKTEWLIQGTDAQSMWTKLGNPQSASATIAGTLAKPTERGGPFLLNASQISVLTTNQNLCQNTNSFVLKAGSDQPFWSLFLDEQKVSLTTPDGVYSFTLDDVTQPADRTYQFELKGDKDATLYLKAGECSEPSAPNHIEGYEASLTIDGSSPISGCAEFGHSLLAQGQNDQVWYGRDSMAQADVTVTLHPNLVAEMLYHSAKGPDVTYRGIWQHKSGQIELIFNKRLGLPTEESIPFTVSEDRTQLTAAYREYAAGRAYFDKPLILQKNKQVDNPEGNTSASTTAGSGNSNVVLAAPLTAGATDNSFAADEKVITGGTDQNGASASATNSTDFGSESTIDGFTAGMLRASTQADADVTSALKTQNSALTQYRFIKTDLNGDGQLDVIAQAQPCNGNSCTAYVFQSTQGQMKLLGQIPNVNGQLMVTPTAHHGFSDILVPSGQNNQYFSYLFNGNQYQAASAQAGNISLGTDAMLQLDFSGNWLTIQ